MENLISVSSLQERYNLSSRQAVDDRIKGLNIQKPARGKISQEQLDKLDKLDKYLKTGGKIENFAQPVEAEIQQLQRISADERELSTGQLDKPALSSGQLDKSSDNFIELVREIAAALKPVAPPMEPLLYLKELERAAAAGWLLSTDQVTKLVGVKPITKYGKHTFIRGSFAFSKIPLNDEGGKPRFKKIGSHTAWRVSKVVE
ncbi:hypothetical protein H6F78_00385 [Coleofasciculus sp. FACHB-64]|uniref:hypothetical protein n=1 Tax=Cyanophyceae TaxID=3028117 RepID=UPI001687A51C|nr:MULTISPECIES: hypothetical protein [unclassified Coleofasciculus]MBD1903457.1 hypothetical protein [Coleofasciculus sp. FACHB-125]MBD1942550.1 hypothetical protein [Coleofasciculus sp. FACHB-712]MBD2044103.1 hypothetical protein [Coleofasciculus sp. FACHB-64]